MPYNNKQLQHADDKSVEKNCCGININKIQAMHVYQPTEIVLAKVKGFSAWPAMVIPEEIIPDNVLKTRPKKLLHDVPVEGTEEEAQEQELDDGDDSQYIVHSEFLRFKKYRKLQPIYCVKFFYDDSYIWVKPTDISVLTKEDCQDWLNDKSKQVKKNKKLVPAYEMAMRGAQDIDVWDFVQYGSFGSPDDEDEYVEDEDEDEEEENAVKPTRISKRQKNAKTKKPARNTRSNKKRQEEKEPEDEPVELEEPPKKRKYKQRKSKEQIPKYHYEDDDDWTIVGLGPQDLSIQQHPIVNKLGSKKFVDRHKDTLLDINDRLSAINKLFLEIFQARTSHAENTLEIILDELDILLNLASWEFITHIQMNTELLINFRLLFNLKRQLLEKSELMQQFQAVFQKIYNHEFICDRVEWSVEALPLAEEVAAAI